MMKRVISIDQIQYSLEAAVRNGLSFKEFKEAIDYIAQDARYYDILVECRDCNCYVPKKGGYCSFWRTYFHTPDDYCSRGDDSSKPS